MDAERNNGALRVGWVERISCILQLDAAFSKARDEVDRALRDSIDTERTMMAIKELIGAANMYMKERRDVSVIVEISLLTFLHLRLVC